jgi:hypothetical protein
MKGLIAIWTVFAIGCSAAVQAQAPLAEEKEKRSGKEIRAMRQEKEREYIEWERTYFNSPGKWYLNVKGGYGWPLAVIQAEAIAPFEFLGASLLSITEGGQVSDRLNLNSDGHGPRVALGVGYMFNRFIGFELELGYINEIRKTRSSIDRPGLMTEFESDLFELYTDPLLVFQSPNMNNFYVYGRLGPHIAHWGIPRAFGTVDDRDGTLIHGLLWDPYQDVLEALIGAPLTQDLLQNLGYRATLFADSRIYLQQDLKDYSAKEVFRGIGVNASFGLKYQATPIVSVFAEARIMGFNVSVAQAIIEDMDAELTLFNGALTVLELTENGGQFLGMPVSKEELKSLLDIIYVNEFDENANNPVYNADGFNNYNPRNELAPRLSVMSMGFQVGLQINFPGRDITYRNKD